ncbi:Retrovirus-related Pol polyprotein from transposon TNT 1-94 [Operophtera brumata]|uniref:Retrovirus-related Pol polyprotein from transposon TNT 1-94 n=1 Tax=Operophtera brumata TaxID=104452 RepID=A0A0L7L039_OPEBR|nr:Retrovirus-related Pol polyprotein from transposon TNT 1-94 [Operophtera brumata]
MLDQNKIRDVVILEKSQKEDTVTISVANTDSVGESMEESVVKLETLDQTSSSDSEYLVGQNNDCDKQQEKEDDRGVQDEGESSSARTQTIYEEEEKEKTQRNKASRYGFANMSTTSIEDGMTFVEAINGPEKQQWLQAMAEELQSFKGNKVWEIIDAPDNVSVVQCKWALRKTYNCDYKVRYRARLVT